MRDPVVVHGGCKSVSPDCTTAQHQWLDRLFIECTARSDPRERKREDGGGGGDVCVLSGVGGGVVEGGACVLFVLSGGWGVCVL